MSSQLHALAPDPFESLFAMSANELAGHRVVRMTVDSKPGYPCRVSLADADIGETVILVNFEHLSATGPHTPSLSVKMPNRHFPGQALCRKYLHTGRSRYGRLITATA